VFLLTANCHLPIALLHFFMRRVLAATLAKLAELQPSRRGLLVLGGGVVPFFALTAL
jgi:hypothetical protein